MIEFYFWLNFSIHIFYSFWCITKRKQTSTASGYLLLNNSGWSEYLVNYGGLRIGLALVYACLALNSTLFHIGLLFSILLYGPIVLCRVITFYQFRVVKRAVLAAGFMEVLLLGGAVFLSIVLENTHSVLITF